MSINLCLSFTTRTILPSRLTDGFNVTGVNGTILMGYVMSNGSAFLWEGVYCVLRELTARIDL